MLENFLNPINVVAVVITVITAAFKFTELRIDRRDDMNDMRVPTLVINIMVAFIASLFMKGSENLGDYLLVGRGEEMGGGRTRQTNLEDVFESVIGAIYLDQGWETAKDYVIRQSNIQYF